MRRRGIAGAPPPDPMSISSRSAGNSRFDATTGSTISRSIAASDGGLSSNAVRLLFWFHLRSTSRYAASPAACSGDTLAPASATRCSILEASSWWDTGRLLSYDGSKEQADDRQLPWLFSS